MGFFSPKERTGVPVQIFPGDGGRLVDPAAIEDREVNALISYAHKMASPLRRPVRMYRHLRNGLGPMKGRSQHMIKQAPRDPGMDLAFVLELEGGWHAANSGTSLPEDEEAKRMVWLGYLALTGGIVAFIVALIMRQFGVQPIAEDTETAIRIMQAVVNGITG